jgi:hypothetical protein
MACSVCSSLDESKLSSTRIEVTPLCGPETMLGHGWRYVYLDDAADVMGSRGRRVASLHRLNVLNEGELKRRTMNGASSTCGA